MKEYGLKFILRSALCEMFIDTHVQACVHLSELDNNTLISVHRKLYSKDIIELKQASKNRDSVFHVASYSL